MQNYKEVKAILDTYATLKLVHAKQTYLPSSSRHVKRFVKSRNLFIKLLDENGYTLTGQYKGVDTPVSVLCPSGHEWDTCNFSSFKKGVRCRVCDGQCPKQAKNAFYNNLKEEGYILLTEYINARTNVTVICPEGHVWDTCNPDRFNNKGVRCKVCDGQDPKEAKKNFYMLLEKNGDEALGDYVNAHEKVPILFGKCGHIAKDVNPDRYKLKQRCPICADSIIESFLATFTKELSGKMFDDVEFEYKILKNEKTGRFLPFDIYIPSKNTIIEIHGQQHYVFTKHYHINEQGFVQSQRRDRQKKEWAISNGYNFIEIDIREHNEESVKKLLESIN